MKIAMIGSGYVGLVSGSCFADFGHDVICVDKDESKIASLNENIMPIYEPGLDILVERNVREGRLQFATEPGQSIQISRLAVESRLFPLFEVKHQNYTINYKPEKKIPVSECMKHQGRFRHLFKDNNQELLEEVQEHTDLYWDRLVAKE